MRQRPVLPLALLAAALSLVAAGCGGKAAGTAALPVLHDLRPVAKATRQADSARFEMRFEMSMPGFGTPFEFTADGAYDTPGDKAEMTIDMSSFAEALSGFAGSFGGNAPPELTDPAKWKIEMLLDGTVAYMRVPFLASELPSGKEWVRVDFAEVAKVGGLDLGELQSFAKGSDPRAALDYLRSVSTGVTRLGTEEVRGVPTTHYFAVMDWQKALARVARDANQPGLFEQFQRLGAEIQNIPVDVWVDAENLVRRMTMDLSVSASGQPQQKASLSMELFDYGAPVTVHAPPAAKVVDAFSLRG